MKSPDRLRKPLAALITVAGLSTILSFAEQRPVVAEDQKLPTFPISTRLYLPLISKPYQPLCLQVITDAVNIETGEYRSFPNSCLPPGWRRLQPSQQ